MKYFWAILLIAAGLKAQSGFITIKDNRFYDSGREFSFIGFNAYYLQSCADDRITENVFKAASSAGFKVIRTWAFFEGSGKFNNSVIRYSPYEYNEKGFEALDKTLYFARKYNIRLILTLCNYYSDFGGIPQYLQWYGKNFGSAGLSNASFFENDTLKNWYKNYMRRLLERENAYTRVKYKNDPSIFSFELINEAVNPGGAAETVCAWYSEMAGYFKSIDKNHLLATGEEGYDKYPWLYSNAGLFYNSADYLFNGYKGTSFFLNSGIEQIDYSSIHLYPGSAGFSVQAGKTWLEDHYKIARSLGKPLLTGEIGAKNDKYSVYNSYFLTFKNSGIKNCVIWQYLPEGVDNKDGYGFNEKDSPDLFLLFRQYARGLEADSVLIPTAEYETDLLQNYPNPFNPVTTVRYTLKTGQRIKLQLYNALGEEVGVLDEGYRPKGVYERVISIRGEYMASGIYICVLRGEGKLLTRKIILEK